ncbi:MAG: hypothetical protein J7L61_00760, partial [Thermoplasmata archaeon]|nr:hypothetical protein [Thermoplasmata archaeon]
MKIWNVRTRVRVFGTALVLLFLFSMVGFILIKRYVEGEDVTFIQALYWTVITLATLGFYPAEIALTSEIGLAFTVGVVLSGVVAIFVGAPSVIAPWLEEKLQWAQRGRRNPLPEGGHIVVVG